MTSRAVRFAEHRALGLLLPLACLAAWQAGAASGAIDPVLWATPATVLHAAVSLCADGSLAEDLLASLRRDLAGLAIGVPVGIAVGTLLARSRAGDRLAGPSLSAVRQVAPFAWVPLISLWLGNDEPAKISFVAYVVFFPVMLATRAGIAGADARLLEVADMLCLTRLQSLLRVILPAALPSILGGIHLAFVYGWLATIGAEYLFSAGPGIGSALMAGRQQFRMDIVVVVMLAITFVGLALNLLAGAAERRLLRSRGL